LKTRIQRIVLRDDTSEKKVKNRIKNQWLEDKKLLQSNYVIDNNSPENTRIQIHKIHNILTEK
jgi:dephospho-CoA kinase